MLSDHSPADPGRRAVGAGHPPIPPPYPHVPVPRELLFSGMKPTGIHLWSVLYSIAVDQASTVFEMSVAEMATQTGLSKPTVETWRRELEAAGWLEVTVLPGLARKQQVTVKVPGQSVLLSQEV